MCIYHAFTIHILFENRKRISVRNFITFTIVFITFNMIFLLSCSGDGRQVASLCMKSVNNISESTGVG